MGGQKLSRTHVEWRAELTREQYAVCRCSAPEPPSRQVASPSESAGSYIYAVCDARLFGSDGNYDPGSGWPGLIQTLIPATVASHDDNSHGIQRIGAR